MRRLITKQEFPRGIYLWYLWVVANTLSLAPGFPGSARVFIASLPGLSGLHVTQKPLICAKDGDSSSKTHPLQQSTRKDAKKFKPAIHNYPQLTATNHRSVTGFNVASALTLFLYVLLRVLSVSPIKPFKRHIDACFFEYGLIIVAWASQVFFTSFDL